MNYVLYMFDRHCQCIYHHRWNTTKTGKENAQSSLNQQQGSSDAGTTTTSSKRMAWEEEAKLVYGVIVSLRNFVNKLSPNGQGGFQTYRTSQYALHYFESASGLKFVIMTDPQQSASVMRDLLRQVYTDAYVECVAKHPVNGYERDKANMSVMKNEAFRSRVEQILGK